MRSRCETVSIERRSGYATLRIGARVAPAPARLADAGLAGEQHRLAIADGRLLPGVRAAERPPARGRRTACVGHDARRSGSRSSARAAPPDRHRLGKTLEYGAHQAHRPRTSPTSCRVNPPITTWSGSAPRPAVAPRVGRLAADGRLPRAAALQITPPQRPGSDPDTREDRPARRCAPWTRERTVARATSSPSSPPPARLGPRRRAASRNRPRCRHLRSWRRSRRSERRRPRLPVLVASGQVQQITCVM